MRVDLPRRSADGEALEPDRDERAGEHGERGIAHVVEHPCEFLFRQPAEDLEPVECVKN